MSDLKQVQGLRPFTKFCCTIGNLPTSYLASMTYEEQLLWFCDYLQNTVIPTVNNNAEAVEELQNLYIELKSYVDNYFANLDVQEEINNKLDEMAESGKLESIINQFIKTNCAIIFENVEAMKNSPLLIDGTYCKTLGFFNKGDCGGSLYHIESGDFTDDNAFIIKIKDNLYAILQYNDTLNLKQLGISSSNSSTTNSSILYNAIKKFENGGTLILPIETIPINNLIIDFSTSGLKIIGQDSGLSGFNCNVSNAFAISFTEPTSSLELKNFRIEANNTSSGIAFEKNNNANHGNIIIDNVYIRNCHKGFKFHNVVYLFANRANAGITSNANNDDYGYEFDGYEYNRLENCACQTNGNVNSFPVFDICRIVSTSYVWIKNCEFVKTGGNSIHIINDTASSSNIYIDMCEFYRVRTGVLIENISRNNSNINITNTHVNLLGEGIENECAVRTTKSESYLGKSYAINITNLSVSRFGPISPSICLFEDDTIEKFSITNVSNNYNSQGSSIICNNNIPSNITFTNPTIDELVNIFADGNTNSFSIIFNAGTKPIIKNKIPQILVQPVDESLINTFYQVTPSFYDSQNRLRCAIKFDKNLPQGNYQLQCHIII